MIGFLEMARTEIGVQARPAFWLTAGIYGWYAGRAEPSQALAWVVVIAASILIHEYGHALAILAFGSGADIELHGFGGATVPRRRQDLAVWKRCLITLAGCGMGLLAAALLFALERRVGNPWLGTLGRVNLTWSLFNLLPMQPLDGGRLLETLLAAAFGPWGRKAALGSSVLVAAAIALFFLLHGSRFNAMLTALFALSGFARMRAALRRVPQDDDPVLRAELLAALELSRSDKTGEAVRALIAFRRKTRAGELFSAATEQLGLLLRAQGRHGAAYALLSGLEDRLSPDGRAVLQSLAYKTGRFEQSAVLGRRNFLETNDPEAAFLLALASARLGDELGAVRWLKTAVRHGLQEGPARLRSREFDGLRGTPGFQELERSLLSR